MEEPLLNKKYIIVYLPLFISSIHMIKFCLACDKETALSFAVVEPLN